MTTHQTHSTPRKISRGGTSEKLPLAKEGNLSKALTCLLEKHPAVFTESVAKEMCDCHPAPLAEDVTQMLSRTGCPSRPNWSQNHRTTRKHIKRGLIMVYTKRAGTSSPQRGRYHGRPHPRPHRLLDLQCLAHGVEERARPSPSRGGDSSTPHGEGLAGHSDQGRDTGRKASLSRWVVADDDIVCPSAFVGELMLQLQCIRWRADASTLATLGCPFLCWATPCGGGVVQMRYITNSTTSARPFLCWTSCTMYRRRGSAEHGGLSHIDV